MNSLDDPLPAPAEDFALLGGWEEQLESVLDPGKALPPPAAPDKTESNRVQGCASRVWLVTDPQADGTVAFRADSDGHISRGNVALLLKLYSGHTPAEILAFDAKAGLERLGLPAALTPQRSNGLFSMVGRIRRDAAALA